MSILVQLITILGMVGATYLIFQSFGARRPNLLYTQAEKKEWDTLVKGALGSWSTVTNLVGTLTSLATVYVFFIGSSKLFGWVTLWCSISIWGSSLATNYFTRKICAGPYIKKLLESSDQVGGVIASVFWRDEPKAKQIALLTKWISLVTIVSIIWLEFALFADISAQLLTCTGLAWKLVLLAFCCFTVTYFTLRYGLRGFVFADLFQSPMIFLGATALFLGCIALFYTNPSVRPPVSELFRPLLSFTDCLLFVFQVASVNFLLILVSESHWLRIWIFGRKETDLQVTSTATTGALWSILTLIGLFAFTVSNRQVGIPAIVGLLSKLNEMSSLFIVAFWVGGMAALFSTADAQIYSFLLVRSFNSSTGKLNNVSMASIKPFVYSTGVTLLFVVVYAIRTYLNLPFEKMIFLVLPICLNVFPAIVVAARNMRQRPNLIWSSLFLYAACSVAALCQPRNEFTWTLAAPVMPVLVGLVAWILPLESADGE